MNAPSLQVFVYYTPGCYAPQSYASPTVLPYERIITFLNVDWRYPVYVWSPLTGQWSRMDGEPQQVGWTPNGAWTQPNTGAAVQGAPAGQQWPAKK